MKIDQVALILYTLREHCKTPADLASTLEKVRAIGYQSVQLSGICDVEAGELKKMLADNGLTACATHEDGGLILNDTQVIIDKLGALDVKYTAYAYPAGIDFNDPAALDELVVKLGAAGAKMAAAGQVLMYHNHGIEFIPHRGAPFLQYIYDATDPKHLQAEIDTYWVQYGGGNPTTWAKNLKDRLPVMHMKDFVFTNEDKPLYTEIGSGWLEFPEIIAAAEASGCQWFVVEQDTTPGDPFDSIKKSFDYIQANLVS